LNVAFVDYGGFVSEKAKFFLSKLGFILKVIPVEYFNNQNKVNIQIDNSEIIVNIVDDCFYGIKSGDVVARFKVINDLIDKIKEATKVASSMPSLLIQGSSTFVYDSKLINEEQSIHFANHMLANEFLNIENHIVDFENIGLKVAILRMGVILDKENGLIKQMKKFSLMQMYPEYMNSKKYIDWVHIDDMMNALHFLMNKEYSGVFNISSPSITCWKELSKQVINKKPFFNMPSFILDRLFYYANLMNFLDIKSVPKRLLSYGFEFKFSNIKALDNL